MFNDKNEPLYIIYMITNTRNGKRYIGKTVQGFRARWSCHKATAKRGSKSHFNSALRLYNLDVWSFNILYVSFVKDDDHLYDVEEELIAGWDTCNSGYNTSKGGAGTGSGENNPMFGRTGDKSPNWGRKHTAEELEKMRVGNTGKVQSPLARSRMIASRTGLKPSLETRQKMRESATGRKITPEVIEKRIVTYRTNPPRKDNKSGIKGVNFHKAGKKWHSRISVNKKEIMLGLYKNKNDAIIARMMGELEHWNQIIIYDY